MSSLPQTSSQAHQTIRLPEACDRAYAVSLASQLQAAGQGGLVSVDGQSVRHIGQQVLQVLVSASKTGTGLVITKPSQPLAQAFRIAGLEAELMPEGPS